MRVRQHAVYDGVVHACFPEPLGGEVSVTLGVAGRRVLVEIVEQAGETPAVLVLAEMLRQAAHDSFDGNQVPESDVLVDLLSDEIDGSLSLHAHSSLIGR